jgi:predicted hotdog family 3-hydroxylacyl-ACP dehydratase
MMHAPSKKLPLPTSELAHVLPHRAPMLWVDEVIEVSEKGGTAAVHMKAGAHYFDGAGNLRPTSPVEWMAQAYGFISATMMLHGLVPSKPSPKRAFFAHMKNIVYHAPLPNSGTLLVQMELEREMGPLSLVKGRVVTQDRTLLVTGEFKLYAE